MNLLLIHRHYWPDTPPYASILKSIAEMMSADGHQVSVYTARPSYKSVDSGKRVDAVSSEQGVTVYRKRLLPEKERPIWNRLLNIFYFPLRVFWHILMARHYDVVMVSTAPPVVLAFFTMLAVRLKGGRLIYNCMDIHPEIGRLSGEFRNPLVYRLLMRLDRWTCQYADLVVVLSEDMRSALNNRQGGPLSTPIALINNFEIEDTSPADNSLVVEIDSGKISMVFAGNIGRFQNLDLLLDMMSDEKLSSMLELIFVGEGAHLEHLKQRVKREQISCVTFIPHQSVSTSKQIIGQCDLGIVSLQPEVSRYAFPSKTFTYLGQGVPILLFAEKSSALSALVEDNQVGLAVDPSEFRSSQHRLEALFSDPERLRKMAENARHHSQGQFSRDEVLATWKQQITQLGNG